MADRNVIRQDIVQIGFEVEQSPINRLERSLEDAQSSAVDLARSADRATEEVSRIGTEAAEVSRYSEELARTFDVDVEEAVGMVTARMSDMGMTASEAFDDIVDSVRRYTEETERARRESELFGENTTDNADESEEAVEGLTETADGLAIALATAAVAFVANHIVQNVSEAQQALNILEAQTGATTAEIETYNKAMQEIYTDGKGGAIGEVANALGLVNQQFKNLDPSVMEYIASNALTLSETFETDLNETLRGVNALMTNMGLTAEEAFDYIAKGTQNGLDKSQELTDNIAEYSQLWHQAGFSAEEMFTILQNGIDSGAYNLDKVNDFVKEFTISLSDGRIEENIESFSEETQNLFTAWQNGGATSKDVFNSVIADLSNMQTEQEALTVASTVWSSMGEDNAMKVITSLNNVNTTYSNVKGTMQSINEVRYDDIGTSMDKLARSGDMALNEVFSPALSTVNNLLSDGLDWVTKFAQENKALSTGLAAGALTATALAVGVGGVVAAATFLPPVIAKITASLGAMHVAAGPVGIAMLAISVAVGAITAAVVASKDEVEDYDGTLEECRHELEATEAAHKKAVERYGENSEAAKDLEKDVEKLSAQYEKGGGAVAEMNERIEETSKSFKELSKAQDEAMNSIDGAETSGFQAVSMLEALSEKANITSTDLDTMAKYADYLNNTFHTNIVVDYDTGKLTGFDPKAVVQSIITAANDKKIQSAMEYLSGEEFTSKAIDAYANLEEVEKRYFEEKAKWESDEFRTDLMGLDEFRELEKAYEDAKDSVRNVNEELDEYGNIVDDSGETTEILRQSLVDTAKSGDEFIAMAEETSEAAEDIDESVQATNDTVAAYNDSLYDLATAYDEALTSAQESVAGQYSAWDEVGDIAETSIGELQTALQSQSDYWGSYADNLALLQEKAQSIEGLSGLLATMADGSEDSAAAIAALAGASDEELTAVVGDWQSVKDKQDEASANMALTQTEFQTKLTAMGENMKGFVADMDMSADATTNASSTINAFIDTIIGTVNARKSEVDIAVRSLMSSANTFNLSITEPEEVQQNANGTTNADDVFIAGEGGKAELIVGKKGSTVFPASETEKIINAVSDYSGGYTPQNSVSNKTVANNTTYAPQFVLNMNGASATDSNKRKIKHWVKEAMRDMLNDMEKINAPIIEI